MSLKVPAPVTIALPAVITFAVTTGGFVYLTHLSSSVVNIAALKVRPPPA